MKDNITDKEFDAILGNVVTQQVIRTLACWEKLTVKELIAKTGTGEEKISKATSDLVRINVLEKDDHGYWHYSTDPFGEAMRKAYHALNRDMIEKRIYTITKNMDSYTPDEYSDQMTYLIEKWKPLLDKYHASKMSSLAGHLIDAYLEDRNNK